MSSRAACPEATVELLVGGPAFWARAAADIAQARRRVLVQAMSFEGDSAGLAAAAAIAASSAADRRVLVDAYSLVNVNDRIVQPLLGRADPAVADEARRGRAMFAELAADGVPVRVTNPLLPLALNFPARNHKKLIVADDAAYVGGINLCDHNFAWDDLMLRLDGPATADFLSHDFDRTFGGRPRPGELRLADLRILSLDGRSNRAAFAA
ncbi:MAG: hypothetical protein JOZ27_08635, partial [Caulobacteraceae bacterium]|nr:hypothetical protein [Caulobacteraceae bacterium]